MAPSGIQAVDGQAAARPDITAFGSQPEPIKPMKPEPPLESETTPTMRGGQRSQACPGRFCFIIPCPIPCDFCII